MTSPNLPVDPAAPPRVAGGVSLLQALLLAVVAAVYGVELLAGEADDANIASMSLVVALIFALLLAFLGVSWWRGRSWPRSPTIVWNLLLLPAAWTLGTTTGPWWGLALAAVAVVGIGAAVLAPSHYEDRAL